MTPPRAAWWLRLFRSRWFLAYALLLALSHLTIALVQPDFWGIDRPDPGEGREGKVTIPALTAFGAPSDSKRETITYLEFAPEMAPASSGPARLPVILLHGSPSSGGADFKTLAPALADAGRTVYAVDLPGFGRSSQWVSDYSIKANARCVLAMMDALNLNRAHVVGWSQGGGSALWAADLAPDRVASISLLGSIGVQEAEGSGSYHFEHTKYAVGWFLFVAIPEAMPHFGAAGPRHFRHAFIRNFLDSDQRELTPLMERLKTPTLILHGRHDFLVPAWAAELSHSLIAPSRLVILDSDHFFPMGGQKHIGALQQAAGMLNAHFARHDDAGAPALRGSAVFAPPAERVSTNLGGMNVGHGTTWWLVILAIVVGTLILEDMTLIAVGLLIADGQIDPFVGLAGCFVGIVCGDLGLWTLGRLLGRRLLKFRLFQRFAPESALTRWGDMLDNHMGKAIFLCRCIPGTRMPTYIAAGMLGRKSGQFVFWELMAVCVWAPALLIAAAFVGPKLLGVFREVFHGPIAIVIALVVLFFVIRALSAEATYEGRHKNKAGLQRLWRYEFWPAWALYLPVAPTILWNALRRGPMSFTCVNPGIENAGGWIGESKSLILRSLLDRSLGEAAWEKARIAPFVYIPGGPDAATRAAVVTDAVRSNPSLGGYPVILKPDLGQRGHAVKLARGDADVRAYFETMTRPAMVQRYADLPCEVGVFWTRRTDTAAPMDERPGRVFSITRKTFPVIEGDGVRALDHLIWDHPRFQMQAPVFLARLGAAAERVPAKGEMVPLGRSGNHCQGAMFTDGADLITPELSAEIERIAQAFRDEQGRRLDFGRFDLRCPSEEHLRRGEGLLIVELNGSSSESTNLYDPGRSLRWALSVLRAQWRTLYALGHARRREGVRPTPLSTLVRAARTFFRGLPGSRVSD